MNGKKVFWIAVGLFVFFFIIASPNDAADIGRSLGDGIQHAFDSFSEFVRDL